MIDNITKREYEILELLANGYNGMEVCDKLFISRNTYAVHTYNMFKKLNIKTVNKAICLYYKDKILKLKQLVKERLHVDNI